MGTSKLCCELVDETGRDVEELRKKLHKFCMHVCEDPKDLCVVCTINAMDYHLRFFELAFEVGEPRESI